MRRLVVLTLILATAAAAAPQVGDEAARQTVLRLARLRIEGDYGEALNVAREWREEVERTEGATCLERWLTAYETLMLERIMELSETARAQFARTDSIWIGLEALIMDPSTAPDLKPYLGIGERAVEARRALLGENDILVADALTRLSGVQQQQEGLEASIQSTLLAVEILEAQLSADHPAMNLVGLTAGIALGMAGETDEVEPRVLRHLAAARRDGCDARGLADMLADLVHHHRMTGRLDSAEYLAREAVAMHRRLGTTGTGMLKALSALHNALQAKGEYDEARIILEEFDACRGGPLNEYQKLSRRAQALGAAGDLDGAERLRLEVARKATDPNDPNMSIAYSNYAMLGMIQASKGDLDAAEESYRAAISIAEELLAGAQGDESLRDMAAESIPRSRFGLGKALLQKGDLIAAEEHARRALAEAEALHEPRHYLRSYAAGLLGKSLYMQGRFEEAELALAAVADAFVQTASDALAASRIGLGRHDDAWAAVESARAATLTEALLGTAARRLTQAESAREDSLEHAVSRLEQAHRLHHERSGGDTTHSSWPLALELRGELDEAQRFLTEFRRQIATKHPLSEGQRFRLERVQSAVPDSAALIGWLDLQVRHDVFRTWAYAVRREGGVRWFELGGADASEPVEELRRLLSDPEAPTPAVESAARTVYSQRLEQLLGQLDGVSDLVVIPSGPMLGVPVEAMIDENGRAMGEAYQISYAPSATALTWLRERHHTGFGLERRALVLGDPVFAEHQRQTVEADQADPEVAVAPRGDLSDDHFVRSVLAGQIESLSLLPRVSWTREEVTAVASVLPGSTVLLGEEASEQELARISQSGQLGDFSVVHLATHALVDDRRPARSALVLTQVELPDPVEAVIEGRRIYDGLLTAREVLLEWDLDADLVVLSACDSGLGRRDVGEGYLGLASAFLQSGARSLVVSLWEVEDKATALLMQRFYENWLGDQGGKDVADDGMRLSKARALREAKLWLRSYTDEAGDHPYEHPYFWASFVLIGDPS